jgi:hypothetical protein
VSSRSHHGVVQESSRSHPGVFQESSKSQVVYPEVILESTQSHSGIIQKSSRSHPGVILESSWSQDVIWKSSLSYPGVIQLSSRSHLGKSICKYIFPCCKLYNHNPAGSRKRCVPIARSLIFFLSPWLFHVPQIQFCEM